MSNEDFEPKPTRVEESQPSDEEVEQKEEEQQPVREITQNDHINKAMLAMFKSRIESGGFKFQNQDDEDQSAMDDEFIDDDEDQKVVEPVSNE